MPRETFDPFPFALAGFAIGALAYWFLLRQFEIDNRLTKLELQPSIAGDIDGLYMRVAALEGRDTEKE